MLLVYMLRRLILVLPVAFGVTVLVFLVVRLAPGDPLKVKMGEYYRDEDVEQLRKEYDLDQPVPIQYVLWLGKILHGDLGRSIFTNEPVLEMITDRAPTTILLSFSSMVFALLISLPLGVLAAVHRDTWIDNGSRLLSILGTALPVFWVGLLLIILFAVIIPVFPPGGTIREYGLQALILPTIAMGWGFAAVITRMTRSQMAETLSEDYIRTARAKGLTDALVSYKHALRNALIPIVTVVGLQLGIILGGAVLTENIFSLPGLGQLLVESATRRDYPVIQGGVLVIALFFVLSNLVVDLLYGVIDPRVRYE